MFDVPYQELSSGLKSALLLIPQVYVELTEGYDSTSLPDLGLSESKTNPDSLLAHHS